MTTTMPAESFEWRKIGLIDVDPGGEVTIDWEAADWRYLQVARTDETDYSAAAFDDSGWALGAAAFGFLQEGLTGFPTPTTEWDLRTSLWLRRDLATSDGDIIRIVIRAEQEFTLWWNGVYAGSGSPGGGTVGPYQVVATGADVLAVRFDDDDVAEGAGGQTYADIQVSTLDTSGGTPNWSETVLALPSLLAWYRCGEVEDATTMLDSSGNARDGTWGVDANLAEPGSLADGDTSVATNGTSTATGTVPYAAWMNSLSGLTMVCAFKYTGTPATVFYFSRGGGTSNNYGLFVGGSPSLAQFIVRTSAAGTLTSSSSYNDGLWHLAVATWRTSDGAMALDIDGVTVATGTRTGTLSTSAQSLQIGGRGASPYWSGGVDEAIVTGAYSDATARAALYTAWINPDQDGIGGGGEEPPDPTVTTGWVTDPDRTAGLVSISATYAARDAVTKPTPLITDVELAGQVAGDCPPVSEQFRLCLSDAAATALGLTDAEAALFTGEVTDPVIDPVRQIHRIGGAGRLGRANRRTLPASGWPIEDDGNRAGRLFLAAEIDTGTVDPGTVSLAAPGEDDTAGALLDVVTDSSGGAVVEQPDGEVDYHDADHRRGGAVVMTLNPSQILNSITWEQHVDDVLNEVEVTWSGGTVKVRDPASIEAHNGVYPGRRSTALTSSSDAHSLGQLVVARRSIPRWQLPDLEIDLMHTLVDDTTRGDLLKLRHGDRIMITDVPGPHPYSGDVEFLVEGWRQTVTRPATTLPWRWRMVLSVSDPALAGVSIRWIDFEPGYAWEDLPAGLSWLDLALIDDMSDL